ncbi:MAG: hypothetical protein KI792_10325 [Alphaproteobacteria bacterium]|nr:hypothetical protein [Alphaproteobacteria bacterium SS10]
MSEAKAETKPDQNAGAGKAPGGSAPGSNAVVAIGGAYEVDPKKPLPALSSPGTKAFEARSKTDPKKQLFALVCQGPMPVRLPILQSMVGLDNAHLIKLAHSGIVVWPPDQVQRVVMLFQRPVGSRLTGEDGRGEIWTHDQVTQKLIAPMVSVLRDLESRKICHGAIRPSNMFAPKGLAEGVVLGECVTQPVGYHQPVLYETLQRGMADPAGRGVGATSDDLYALGMTILTLLQGEPPLAGMSDEDILDRKLVYGSFYALVQKSRVPTNMLEPLRGLLNDDPFERWTLEDIESWLGGRRLSPRPPEPPRKAVRPFEFGAHVAWEARGLARVLSRDPATAHRLYEQGEVEAWMRRALGEKNITEIVVAELEAAGNAPRNQREPEVVVSRCGIAMAPDGPIRLRGRAAFPSGIGGLLTEAVVNKRDPSAPVQMILAGMSGHWGMLQKKHKIEPSSKPMDLEQLRNLLERSGFGFGLERALYELDDSIPCQSPMLDKHYVLTPNDLLRALERLAPVKSRHGMPIDAHIAAFLMVRFRKLEDWLLKSLNDQLDPGRSVVAMAQILGSMQERLGNKKLPGLSKWIVGLADPAIDRLHNHDARKKLKAKVEELAEEGMITPIAQALDDPTTMNQDAVQYGKAQAKFAKIVDEIAKLEEEISDPDLLARGFGRELAAVVSGMLGALGTFGVIGYYMFGGI